MIRRWSLRREILRDMVVLEMAYKRDLERRRVRYEAHLRYLERKLQDTYKRPR